MVALSDHLEQALLNHVLRNTAYTSPTTVYLALFTDDPTDADAGTEVSGGSYARQAITFAAPSAEASGGGYEVLNSAAITFTDMPAVTLSHMAIFDADTAGNMLMHGTIKDPDTGADTTVAVTAGDTYEVAASDLAAAMR